MSTPVGVFSRRIRLQHHLSQYEVANLLGYEQAYVSAIELGSKHPSQEYLLRFAQKLDLNAEEHTELLVAAKTSQRRFVLPIGVAIETYLLCFELWEKIDRLHPAQIGAIRQLLKLDEQITSGNYTKVLPVAQRVNKEVDM